MIRTQRAATPAVSKLVRRSLTAPAAPVRRVSDAKFGAAYRAAIEQAEWWIQRTNPPDPEQFHTVAVEVVIEASHRYEDGALSFASYAFREVKNRLCNEARRQRRMGAAPLSLDEPDPDGQAPRERIADPAPGPEEQLLMAEEKGAKAAFYRELRAAAMRLPPFERKIIEFRYWQGKSQADVAHLLGISQARVQRTEVAARRALKAALAGVVSE